MYNIDIDFLYLLKLMDLYLQMDLLMVKIFFNYFLNVSIMNLLHLRNVNMVIKYFHNIQHDLLIFFYLY